jgi:RimJ/RimL family protein N-acetyltransferase
MTVLHTPRLQLEPFDRRHFEGLQAMNRLPEVMRYITGRPETPEETQAGIERVQARWAEWGYSWWAFLHRETGRVAGAGCIQHLNRDKAQPLEIGWRLHPDFWKQGLAREAAERMARFAFEDLGAPELLAVRHPDNLDSGRLMERLGMAYRGIEHWYETDLAVHAIGRADWLHRGIPA